jgi:BclB C-terminal domain-containing protein
MQLYSAPQGDNTFTPVPGTAVTLSPTFTGIISAGSTATGNLSALSIPVTVGSRLLLVFSSTAAGLSLNNTVSGYYSGGVSIQ